MLKTVLPFSITFIIGSLLGGGPVNLLDLHAHGSRTREACHRRVHRSKTWLVIHSLGESSPRMINLYRNRTYGLNPSCELIKVHVLLGADGEVAQVYPSETYVNGATDDAISAAEQIRFTPATRDGVPVSVWLDVTYCGPQGLHERTARTVDGEEWLVLDE